MAESEETTNQTERERVLKMLEEGKIIAEECGELLSALDESSRQPTAPQPPSKPRKMVVIGAVLVLIGFFLPWLVIDLNVAISEMRQKVENALIQQLENMQNNMPGSRTPSRETRPDRANLRPRNFSIKINGKNVDGNAPLVNGGTLHIYGKDVSYGCGWIVLLLAAIVAFAPLEALWPHPVLRRKIALLLLGIGSFLLLYLLTQNFRFVSFGLVVVFAGYALELAGTIKSRPDDELR